MIAERIMYASVDSETYGEVQKYLLEGWKMDPFFHTSGRPWSIDAGHLWVLVKGTPEEIVKLNPFVEMPQPEVAIPDKFAGIVDVVEIKTESVEDGRVKTLTDKGYEVFNVLKGLTILVKRQDTGVTASEDEGHPEGVN